MARKYLSKRTRTKHTYEFYKQRKDSPQWRDDFLEVRKKYRIEIAIQVLIILVLVTGGTLYFSRIKSLQLIARPAEIQTNSTANSSSESSQLDENVNNSTSSYQHEPAREDDSQLTSSSEVQISTSNTESSTSQNPEPSLEDSEYNGDELAVKEYINDGFIITPIMYNGENINRAMDEGKASQNIVHDGFVRGYIKNNTTVRQGIMNSAYDEKYSIDDNILTIGRHNFSYQVNNGQIIFNNENEIINGTKITWQIKSDSSMKNTVDNMPTQN